MVIWEYYICIGYPVHWFTHLYATIVKKGISYHTLWLYISINITGQILKYTASGTKNDYAHHYF